MSAARAHLPTHVDLLITHARIFSDGRLLEETALAATDGRIVALGGNDLADRLDAAHTIDAGGGLLTPSFVDAHVHTTIAGVETLRCDLSGSGSAEESARIIRAYAAAHPERPWVLGGGWRMPHYPGGTPTREALDALVPDRPAFLLNADHHGAWANTRALAAAGITRDTPDPEDGRIERDADGRPTGTLHEGAAELVGRVLPETTEQELRDGLLAGARELHRVGITGWQEAILGEYAGYGDFSPIYRDLVGASPAAGPLRGRATGALWVDRDFAGGSIREFVAALERRRAAYETSGFRLDTAKIMVDGVAENETAALDDPYTAECSCTGGRGLAYFTREELLELVPLLNARGFSAHFHAIGDRAVRYALDAVAAVPEAHRLQVRNHIAHLQVINPRDVPRFRALGVTANLQPLWACLDDQMTDLTLPLLGPERARWQYLFASLERSGAALACGSDWPVSSPDPWQGMHVAVNRREPAAGGEPGEENATEPLLPEEAVSLSTILTAYTHGSHRLLGLPGGRIAPGEVCDLALADRDPFASPPGEIHRTRTRLTILDGAVIFDAAESASAGG